MPTISTLIRESHGWEGGTPRWHRGSLQETATQMSRSQPRSQPQAIVHLLQLLKMKDFQFLSPPHLERSSAVVIQ